jgi:hypothetical protein
MIALSITSMRQLEYASETVHYITASMTHRTESEIILDYGYALLLEDEQLVTIIITNKKHTTHAPFHKNSCILYTHIEPKKISIEVHMLDPLTHAIIYKKSRVIILPEPSESLL